MVTVGLARAEMLSLSIQARRAAFNAFDRLLGEAATENRHQFVISVGIIAGGERVEGVPIA